MLEIAGDGVSYNACNPTAVSINAETALHRRKDIGAIQKDLRVRGS